MTANGAVRVMAAALQSAACAPTRCSTSTPRHLDALQRQARVAGHPHPVRGTRGQDWRLVHQVDDRPHAWAGGRIEAGITRWPVYRQTMPRRSTQDTPDPECHPGLRALEGPDRADHVRNVQLFRVRRHQRRPAPAPFRRLRPGASRHEDRGVPEAGSLARLAAARQRPEKRGSATRTPPSSSTSPMRTPSREGLRLKEKHAGEVVGLLGGSRPRVPGRCARRWPVAPTARSMSRTRRWPTAEATPWPRPWPRANARRGVRISC